MDKLSLFRPAGIDLVLSKMARANDPDDQTDILEIVKRENLTEQIIETAFQRATHPNEPVLIDQFELAKDFIRSHYEAAQGARTDPKKEP